MTMMLGGGDYDIAYAALIGILIFGSLILFIGYVLLDISSVFAFSSIHDIGPGILLSWGTGLRIRPILQWVAYRVAFIEIVLLLVKLGDYETYYTYLYKAKTRGRSRIIDIVHYRYVYCAYTYLLLVAATGLLSLSIMVMFQTRKNVGHHQSVKLQLAASTLFWVPNVWYLISISVFSLAGIYPGRRELILEAILGPWLQFVVLAILTTIGRNKMGGLYSTSHNAANKLDHSAYNG
ncbi:hypothetical protein BKA67DRAFT_694846 [Truncatella angustata]|uniref:Uncharacterized protein n=1 Tax=Truncatella angustata TaxID=152316 RepID=A0A9P8RQX1_9PEZI|nr:uncharacterized protein BKA67DRAFT_694846 [Truncatella angustata]KAH6647863.1 hypothetical protein BKA67DRAFT_694846 [Truncatella angustata]